MDDANFMDVLDAGDKLVEHFSGFGLGDSLVLDDVVEELALFHELHDQEELFRSFDDFIKLDYMGVPDQLEDVDLPADPLDVRHLRYLTLFQDFDGYLLLRRLVGG